MINLKSFISAVHRAIMAASDQLRDRNAALIDTYFEDLGDDKKLRDALNNVLQKLQGSGGGGSPDRFFAANQADDAQLVETLRDALQNVPSDEKELYQLLTNALQEAEAFQQGGQGAFRASSGSNAPDAANGPDALRALHDALYQDENPNEASIPGSGSLRPKSVVVQYPYMTKEGTIDTVDVHVPLITLVPLSFSEVKEAKLRTDFELHVNNDELQVGFPGEVKQGDTSTQGAPTTGHLEITIGVQEPSAGLKTLVDGYERTLRAQIPH